MPTNYVADHLKVAPIRWLAKYFLEGPARPVATAPARRPRPGLEVSVPCQRPVSLSFM
ncbi:hypothetical protein SGPA1_21941 [Streptomyces misionensis JCM 4497]